VLDGDVYNTVFNHNNLQQAKASRKTRTTFFFFDERGELGEFFSSALRIRSERESPFSDIKFTTATNAEPETAPT